MAERAMESTSSVGVSWMESSVGAAVGGGEVVNPNTVGLASCSCRSSRGPWTMLA